MPKTSMANIAFNLDGPLPRFLILLRLLELVPRRSTAAELVDGPILLVAAVGCISFDKRTELVPLHTASRPCGAP